MSSLDVATTTAPTGDQQQPQAPAPKVGAGVIVMKRQPLRRRTPAPTAATRAAAAPSPNAAPTDDKKPGFFDDIGHGLLDAGEQVEELGGEIVGVAEFAGRCDRDQRRDALSAATAHPS